MTITRSRAIDLMRRQAAYLVVSDRCKADRAVSVIAREWSIPMIRIVPALEYWLQTNSTARAKLIVEQPNAEYLLWRRDEPLMLDRQTLHLYGGITFAVELIIVG